MTTLRVLEQLNEGEPFDDFDLAVLYKKIPADLKASMISPYLSEDGHQLEARRRIEDSDPGAGPGPDARRYPHASGERAGLRRRGGAL